MKIIIYFKFIILERPSKKQRLSDNLTLEEALEKAGLFSKATAYGGILLSSLNSNERPRVLKFLGEKTQLEDSYAVLIIAPDIYRRPRSFQNPRFIYSPYPSLLPIVNKHKLYIRESYIKLYNYIMTIFADKPLEAAQNRIIVTGTSGIGKSAFLVYFIVRLLAEKPGNQSPIILFHTKSPTSECYAFGGDSFLRVGTIKDFKPFLYLPETWYLVDSVTDPVLGNAKTIIAVSPKTLNSETNEYQHVLKESPSIYYMAPWSKEELEFCRNEMYFGVSKELMTNLYTKIGGVPGYVLQNPSIELARDKDDITGAELAALARIDTAIDGVKDPAMLLDYVRQKKNSLEFSSRLLHRWPDEINPKKYYLRWASGYIQAEIIQRLRNQSWMELLKNLVMKDNDPSLRGRLFELYVIHIFRQGNQVFECKELQKF